jgi:hypothetical protein
MPDSGPALFSMRIWIEIQGFDDQKMEKFTDEIFLLFFDQNSVLDPWNFGVDPDPRIHASD